jgi:hypothetical protein
MYPHSHILGELRYVMDEGRRVTGLALWDHPVAADEAIPMMPVVIAVIIGDARMIRCRRCDRSQRWEIGRAGILALMGRLGLQDNFLETEGKERKKLIQSA